MQNNQLTLHIANNSESAIAVCLLGLLGMIASLLSAQPVFMSIFVIFLFGAGWCVWVSGLLKNRTRKLTLQVFPDGQLRLESSLKDRVRGKLEGQQWCTHWFAVLRIRVEGTTHRILVLSTQQKHGDFRRLNMWLRQDFFRSTHEDGVLDL